MRIYNKGDIVEIYIDYQNNKNLLGKAELVEYISTGLPFLIDDYPNAPLFNTEKWIVKWIEKNSNVYSNNIHNIRYNKIESEVEREEFYDPPPVIFDKFLEIDGEEIY